MGWFKEFIFDQKNFPLNITNNAHKQIIKLINSSVKKFNNNEEITKILGVTSPLGIGNSDGNSNSNNNSNGNSI